MVVNIQEYHINVIWTPLLNRTPPIENSNTTPLKYLYLGQKLVKLEPNLNWTPPKISFWEIETRGSNNVDTVNFHVADYSLETRIFYPFLTSCLLNEVQIFGSLSSSFFQIIFNTWHFFHFLLALSIYRHPFIGR